LTVNNEQNESPLIEIEPDSPAEQAWVAEQRERVEGYLASEGLAPATVAAEPELIMAPVLALWEVQGEHDREPRRWWVVSGDVPTDHVAWERAAAPRDALRTLAKKWRTAASVMAARTDADNADQVSAERSQQVAQQLFERAKMLRQLVDHDALWGE
jgi:hypothetical protein